MLSVMGMETVMKRRFSKFGMGLCFASALLLSACQTSGKKTMVANHLPAAGGKAETAYVRLQDADVLAAMKDPFVESMLVAAFEAEQEGRYKDMMVFARKAHTRLPENADLAWLYARSLRFNGENTEAIDLLTPFTVREGVSADVNIEFASALLASDRLGEAKRYIDAAEAANAVSHRIWNVKGVYADAMGQHVQAQEFFDTALMLVDKGDERSKAVILNNKALSMASQGDATQARGVIEQAMTGAQYFPQIKLNQDVLGQLSDGEKVELSSALDSPVVKDMQSAEVMENIMPAAGDHVLHKAAVSQMKPIVEEADIAISQ